MSKRRPVRWVFGGVGALSGLTVALGYFRADSSQRRKVKVSAEGGVRFLRSISVGLVISLDYWWSGKGLDEVSQFCWCALTGIAVVLCIQDSREYDLALLPCHQRSADRIVSGALKNGGLYIKLGQGLGTFNQVLPRQYIDTLKSLQDKVRKPSIQNIALNNGVCIFCRHWLGNSER